MFEAIYIKQAIKLFIIILLSHSLNAQSGCVLELGDSCRLSNQGTEFRTKPNYGYRILGTINNPNTFAKALILQTRVSNGYVKVKLVSLKGDTSGIGHLYNAEAWVKKGFIKCFATYEAHDLSDTSIAWNEDILLAEAFRKRKFCKYSSSKHAQLLLDRARASYREEAYESAVKDIDRAIDVLKVSDNLIIYHWYRAHAKSELGDLFGAIADFDYIIDNKDSLETASYEFDLDEVLCWKAQNLYLAGEHYKAKSILNIVIATDPANGFAYYLRGLVRYYLGKNKEGCEDLYSAAKLGFEESFEEIQEKCH